MGLPIAVLLPVLQQAATILKSQAKREAARHKFLLGYKSLENESEAQWYEYQARVRALDLEGQRMLHEKQILLQVIDNRRQLDANRFQLIERFFSLAEDILKSHQAALREEMTRVSTRLDQKDLTNLARELAEQRMDSLQSDMKEISTAAMHFSIAVIEISEGMRLSTRSHAPSLPDFEKYK